MTGAGLRIRLWVWVFGRLGAAIQVMLSSYTLSSPENRSHGHSGRLEGGLAESMARRIACNARTRPPEG